MIKLINVFKLYYLKNLSQKKISNKVVEIKKVG